MAIIGISGKIGSGKDTVGKIIQYLTIANKNKDSQWSNEAYFFNNNNNAALWLNDNSDFKIKKYADKLKDIVCLLIGCTREQLEDADFKNKELGEEWWFNHIVPEHGFGSKLINWGKDLKPQKLTPRLLLQLLGTDCGRNIIHPNIWVNSLMSEYKHKRTGKYYNDQKGEVLELPNWIITDMRFPNELQAIKVRGGITIRVNRKFPNIAEGVSSLFVVNEHPSETALDSASFDYVIENNGTIDELVDKVKVILETEKII